MGQFVYPEKVQFFCALLGESPKHLQKAIQGLSQKLPSEYPLHHISEPFPFEGTSYYADEMGHTPWRQFCALGPMLPREQLPDLKHLTNQIELELFDGKRQVNLDPGYITPGQLILATTKDQRHRIYLRDGIFAEVTLFFENKKWGYYNWTYRDWTQEKYHEYFYQLRRHLMKNRFV